MGTANDTDTATGDTIDTIAYDNSSNNNSSNP
jgi:hypothetical protein